MNLDQKFHLRYLTESLLITVCFVKPAFATLFTEVVYAKKEQVTFRFFFHRAPIEFSLLSDELRIFFEEDFSFADVGKRFGREFQPNF